MLSSVINEFILTVMNVFIVILDTSYFSACQLIIIIIIIIVIGRMVRLIQTKNVVVNRGIMRKI